MRTHLLNPKALVTKALAAVGGADQPGLFDARPMTTGEPLMVPIDQLDEDPHNPRTEFPAPHINELAQDIAQRGVLQPIVVAAKDAAGRYLIRMGSKRWRAARQAGLATVPVVVAIQPRDAYDQVAENLKRHGLTPLELARFLRCRVDAGESNAAAARRLSIDLTTVAHHLALLELPPVLDDAMQSGRCTSPRTLYELNKLHDSQPHRVAELVTSDGPITRETVAALRGAEPALGDKPGKTFKSLQPNRTAQLLSRVNGLCDPLNTAIAQLTRVGQHAIPPEDLTGELLHRASFPTRASSPAAHHDRVPRGAACRVRPCAGAPARSAPSS